ncbi:TnsA-like heteromeric transposase endonuclease subunit [Nocardia sp. NBC_01730]|uniref:TnsA-like heteromeric transposase endonuclease subunit n=1 Tax=Nocardia sp. NBC_01730 TaxID=2975998 RepID=UPI002E15999C|nr:TnsA-like heteromeric transposase endonuclease subunit [Nocardia sp. NBC_01730]
MEFVGAAGRRERLPLAACVATRFEDAAPARGFPSYRGQRNFTGSWWSSTTGSHIGYESWLERDWLMDFDSAPAVKGIASQPFQLSWPDGEKTIRHVPDYFLRTDEGQAVVVDVRPDSRVDADDQAVFDRTARWCASLGWRYRRVGEMPLVRAANLRWLSGYRHPRCRRPGLVARFGEVFAAPRRLADGIGEVGDPIVVTPTLFHLLWHRELAADIDAALLGPDFVVGGGTP